MAIQLLAPRMGEGVEELTVVKWLKREGDPVEELEPVIELETDKVATEIPSPASGVVLKILVEAGAEVPVGSTLAWIGQLGEEIPSSEISQSSPSESGTTEDKTPVLHPSKSTSKTSFLSPLVRIIAEENNINVEQISGSGRDGRITKKDVLAFIDMRKSAEPEIQPRSIKPTAKTSSASRPHLQPLSSMRRKIAQRMVASVQTIPHVLTVMEADMRKVLAHRAANKALFSQDGVRLTLTAYFIDALAKGLKTNPIANSSWSEEGLVMHPEINIGMAVALGEDGLIVPVIREADTLSLFGIARKINDLASRARAKQLLPEEVQDASFSLTNHGISGSLFATPIITEPQVGILGTGAMQKRAVVISDEQKNDSIAIRQMVYLSFVFDHRVLDGESADHFLSHVKAVLENYQ
jgi:2-oxoisovalerate dehydrogenase E2 component (dihydrolipoyl transacylase)